MIVCGHLGFITTRGTIYYSDLTCRACLGMSFRVTPICCSYVTFIYATFLHTSVCSSIYKYCVYVNDTFNRPVVKNLQGPSDFNNQVLEAVLLTHLSNSTSINRCSQCINCVSGIRHPQEWSVDSIMSAWEWSRAGPLHRQPNTQDVQTWKCSWVVCCHFSHSEKDEVTWYLAKGWFICSAMRMEQRISLLPWESSEMSLPNVTSPRLVICQKGKRWAEWSTVFPSPFQDTLKCSFQFGFLHQNIDCESCNIKADSNL